MKKIATLLIYSIVFYITACSSGTDKDKLVPKEFEKRFRTTSGNLIDVRTVEEFNEGHIANAVNVDFYDPAFRDKIKKMDKSKPTYIYCRSGKRSSKALSMFKEEGFAEVYDLKGGINEWLNDHLPTVQ